MKITAKNIGNILVVNLSGKLTVDDGASTLGAEAKKWIATGSRNIILDMSGLHMMDSSGLGELVNINKSLGGKLILLNVGIEQKRIFDLTNLSNNFQFYDNEAEAIDTFG
jgi:anti-sigma B factor antagonist